MVRNKVCVLGDIRELHKLNAFIQLVPLSEQSTAYGVSVLADLAKSTGQSVTGVLHGGWCVLANNGIVVNGHFKAPVDIIPRGVNLGILLLIIEQEDDGHTHLFHCKQEAQLHRCELMHTMYNDAVKGLLFGYANSSFATLYFLRCSGTFFDFLLCKRNNDLFELLTRRCFGKTEKRAFLRLFEHVNKELLLGIAFASVNGRCGDIKLNKQAHSFEEMVLILLQRHMKRLADSALL